MKSSKFALALVLASVLAFSAIAFAQVDPAAVVVANADFLMQLWASIGKLPGMAVIGVAYLAIQLLLLASQTAFVTGLVPGKVRLIIVYALSLILVPVGLHVAGVSWAAAFLHANTFAAFSVFINQIWKQIFTPKGDVPVGQ